VQQEFQWRPVRSGIRRLQWAFFTSALLLPAVGSAQNNNCTWLNEATASGVLGGMVTLEAQKTADGGGTCIFRTQKGDAIRTLQIDVRIVKDARQGMTSSESQCTSPAIPIRGVGNEAVSCGADARSVFGEQVISYVRDQAFVLRITTTDKHDLTLTRELLQQNARNIAEQVAGSLF
jgi:hypothetical protein